MRISDWSSDVCSSDLGADGGHGHAQPPFRSSRLIGAERQPTSDCRQSLQQSHGKLKILIKPVRGFKSIPTAYATIKGFEVMRALRKGQARPWCLQPGIRGEVRLEIGRAHV